MAPDLRATLTAIARGESVRAKSVKGAPVLSPAAVKADQRAYAAWRDLVRAAERAQGEPLVAPSAALSPLP